MYIYCDFMLRSEWSLINIPGTMGLGPNKLLVVKGLIICLSFFQIGCSEQLIKPIKLKENPRTFAKNPPPPLA